MNGQEDIGSSGANVWALIMTGLTTPPQPTTARSPRKKCKNPPTRQLEHDVHTICRRNPQGPHATQIDRERTLLLCARQLFEKGVRRKRAVNLNDADIRCLVEFWHEQQLTAAMIRNRLHYLRWLAKKIGKPQLIAQSNRVYGAGRSKT